VAFDYNSPKDREATRLTQHSCHNPRITRQHGKQHAGWAFGLAAALFPIAQGGGGDANLAGEPVLGRACFLADRGYVDGREMVDWP
jgi:hypothetical protein